MEETTSVALSKKGLGEVEDNSLLVGFFKENPDLSDELKKFDSDNTISSFIKDNNFKAEKGEVKSVYINKKIKNIALVGLGEKDKFNLDVLSSVIAEISKKLRDSGNKSFSVFLNSFNNGKIKNEDVVEKITLCSLMALYKFTKYKTKDDNGKKINQITLLSNGNFDDEIKYSTIVADAVNKTRDLINSPPNVATPDYVASYAKELAKKSNLKCTVFDEKQIEKMKMECLYSVGKGSVNKPRLAILEYNGGGDKKPVAIVGKGITFDTGGINVKPHPYIINMKDDKGGAVAAIHIIEACSKLKLPINIMVVTPLAENMIDSTAYRPDDVLTAYNKVTVEIKNTDAEGRLVLADGLAYAAEQKPQAIFDIASLTGAARIVLGNVGSPFMSNDPKLSDRLKKASDRSLEKIWELPLWEEYDEDIKGDIADIKNIGNNGDAGTIIGGMFLKHFVDDLPWAHIDIGETVFAKAEKGIIIKGATGASVRLMVEMLREWKS
ncbi:hypothetical protein CMO83_03360 [Candidatus Woesearchaeota archaeon]|jgi:leucyl aminopeptidase|nr:hypothetical protein [Candidatus Woesearchaeota archaeon]MDP6648083.1 leucyl aminopeptidase [Candidatus Woesearchaeota archaeon]|tara:strand:- start:6486 stop:7970 length:1485 start_codon:yes stop_codon:yes gene_type:complete